MSETSAHGVLRRREVLADGQIIGLIVAHRYIAQPREC